MRGPHVRVDSARRPARWVRLLPIAFFELYLTATVLMFAYGPWPWPIKNGPLLYGFLALAQASLLAGYLAGWRARTGGYHWKWPGRRILLASLFVNLTLLIPTAAFRTGSVVPDLGAALADLGRAYRESNQLRLDGEPIVEYVRVLVAPLLFWLVPLTVFYWKALRPWTRWAAALVVLANMALWVAQGTNKGVADVVLLLPSLVLAGHLSGVSRLNRVEIRAVSAFVVILLVGFIAFFTLGQSSRAGGQGVPGFFPAAGIYADDNCPISRVLPPELQGTVRGVSAYLNQGYYALSLALEKPFKPTWGVGNSYTTIRQAERVLGAGTVSKRTYPFQIEEDGWDAYGNWSSIYPWIASDVSFPGTIVVVFAIGYVLARSWLDTLSSANPFAVATFSEFVIMLYYFPANNQVLQTPESFAAFFGSTVLWLLTRNRWRLTGA